MFTINKSFIFLFAIVFLILVTSCGIADGGKVTTRDVLKQSKDADIIQYDGFVFSNATNLEWFEDDKNEIPFSKDHFLGEIKKQTTSSWLFTDLNATKLPKGTKVYSVDEKGRGMLFVEYEGEELYYLVLLEG